MARNEEIVGSTEPTMPMPLIGELIVVLGSLYRCVSVEWADRSETRTGKAEIRVRFREETEEAG